MGYGQLGLIFLVLASLSAFDCLAQTPSATPPKRQTGDGLKGTYFNGFRFPQKITERTDARINFFYDGFQPPVAGVHPQLFSIRWSGQLLAPKTGPYVFSSIADDGVRIWVGGVKVMEEWRERGRKLFSRRVMLQGGQFYEIRVEYVNYRNGGYVDLDWEVPDKIKYSSVGFSSNRTIIPTAYLFSDPTPVPPVSKPVLANKPVLVSKSVDKPSLAKGLPKQINPRKPPVIARLPPQRKAPTGSLPTPPLPPVSVPNPFVTLEPGDTQTLQQVEFAQSSYVLLPGSSAQLDKLLLAMRANPHWRITLAGHTDNVGDPRLNVALSENRAKVVAAYLIRHGVAEDRITTEGYGSSRPVVANTSEAQRAQNRRVELMVE